jgi:DNA-binding NarL/FixJ family response regulator
MKNCLYIVDDHRMLLTGLKFYLETNTPWNVPVVCTSGNECLEKLEQAASKDTDVFPEILIVDEQLIGEAGFTLVQKIAERYPQIRCVMYSMYDTAGYIMQAKDCGVKGYISKVASEDELVHCLEIVQSGGTYFGNEDKAVQKKLEPILPMLTNKEKRILEMILQNKSNSDIKKELKITAHTVENYVSDIYDKINVKSREELLEKLK